MGELRGDKFNVVFTSDLKRAIDTAELAFGGRCPHIQDARLRECDFGDLTQKPKEWDVADYIEKKYPNGESYSDVEKRISSFLEFLRDNYGGKHVGIVAHQAPQLGLDVLTQGVAWEEAIKNDWRKRGAWQPGWEYALG